MGKRLFMAIHEISDQMRPEPFTNNFIQETINSYQDSAAAIGCTAIGVFSSFEKRRNFCLTEAESAEQVRQAHEEGVPRDSIVEILEVKEFKPSL